MPTEGSPDPQRVPVNALVDGTASGPACRLDEPLSLWGGLDPQTGLVVDERHPQHGVCVARTVLLMPHGRGSSSASSVLAEAIRLGTAPAAFVLYERDEIVALGCLAAEETYGLVTPVAMVDPALVSTVGSDDVLTLHPPWLEVGVVKM